MTLKDCSCLPEGCPKGKHSPHVKTFLKFELQNKGKIPNEEEMCCRAVPVDITGSAGVSATSASTTDSECDAATVVTSHWHQ